MRILIARTRRREARRTGLPWARRAVRTSDVAWASSEYVRDSF
ncbi:hypothetical protein HMPREF0972_00371 [Actinomyces sp. oral taxon 848 str. F0332]|nr:hypothetical protein HMPREF0972_00371 [Actinomyces sp. oral taxon 848 str. F0332]